MVKDIHTGRTGPLSSVASDWVWAVRYVCISGEVRGLVFAEIPPRSFMLEFPQGAPNKHWGGKLVSSSKASAIMTILWRASA